MLHWKTRGNLPELFETVMNGSWGGMQGRFEFTPQPVVESGEWILIIFRERRGPRTAERSSIAS